MVRAFVFFTFVLTQGCLNTALQVSSTQWQKCQILCEEKLAKAGLDVFNGDRLCTCEDGRKLRYENEKHNDD